MIQIESQLKEFAKASLGLFWQRQATFFGATILAAYYVNINIAVICYGICQLSEFFDYRVAKRVLKWDGQRGAKADQLLSLLTISSVLSSISIVQYIILVALAEGPSLHLGPLFFLFAAALYATMNNCQVPRVLVTRMAIYSAVFVFIPVYDLWIVRPPLESDLWAQLGVVLFVLYFVIECSRSFLRSYQTGLIQFEELRIERDRAAKAYKVHSEFVSVVSHELRTPLTSIKGSLDLINSGKLGDLPDHLGTAAEIAQKNSNRLAILIDDLLDFQKLKAGRMVLRFSKIDLEQFVREAVEVNRAFGVHRSVSIRVFGTDAPMFVNGDPDRLMQVMGNVLSNAIKFSESGGVVDVMLEKQEEKARISIRDNGVGIPENSKDIVFGPFTQVDSSDNRKFGGTGLGMSITKQILKGHGGTIDYSSKVGDGTTFVIELDLIPAVETAPSEEIPRKRTKRSLSIARRQNLVKFGTSEPAQDSSA